MYPNDNRYPDNLPPMDNIPPPMYNNNQMRTSSMSMDMSNNRPPYYDAPYYDKAPPMMQPPMYDYMNQPPMMPPMNQVIDPRYPNWRQASENRGPIMPNYYDRPPMGEPYMHPKPPISNMPYPQSYPPVHEHMSVRPSQMNILQRISFLIKPQLPQLKRIMLKVSNSSVSYKKKQSSKRDRSREREREREKDRQRSHQKRKPSNSPSGQWVCSKCSFLNFDWRDKCMKCNESKPSFPLAGKNFIPGPQDWKCVKCGNLNYARRHECNRCKLPKNNNK